MNATTRRRHARISSENTSHARISVSLQSMIKSIDKPGADRKPRLTAPVARGLSSGSERLSWSEWGRASLTSLALSILNWFDDPPLCCLPQVNMRQSVPEA